MYQISDDILDSLPEDKQEQIMGDEFISDSDLINFYYKSPLSEDDRFDIADRIVGVNVRVAKNVKNSCTLAIPQSKRQAVVKAWQDEADKVNEIGDDEWKGFYWAEYKKDVCLLFWKCANDLFGHTSFNISYFNIPKNQRKPIKDLYLKMEKERFISDDEFCPNNKEFESLSFEETEGTIKEITGKGYRGNGFYDGWNCYNEIPQKYRTEIMKKWREILAERKSPISGRAIVAEAEQSEYVNVERLHQIIAALEKSNKARNQEIIEIKRKKYQLRKEITNLLRKNKTLQQEKDKLDSVLKILYPA